MDNSRRQLADQKGPFCNINRPPPMYSLAPFPISDCESRLHLPVVSRVYFGGGSPRHFCVFMNRLLCGRGGLGVKAFSVSVCMCVLYSPACVYPSVSYGCFFPPQLRVWKRIYVNVPVCATPRPGGISLHLKGRLCRLVCLLLRNVFFLIIGSARVTLACACMLRSTPGHQHIL